MHVHASNIVLCVYDNKHMSEVFLKHCTFQVPVGILVIPDLEVVMVYLVTQEAKEILDFQDQMETQVNELLICVLENQAIYQES